MYSDFCTGEILSLSNGVQSVMLDTDLMISSFGEGEAGEICVVGLGGAVHRIINPNASPTDPPSAAVALPPDFSDRPGLGSTAHLTACAKPNRPGRIR